MFRDNPLRSLIVGQASEWPIADNLGAKIADGGLDYSMGLNMLLTAPSMNPWVEFMD
jgi:hypothetical protein